MKLPPQLAKHPFLQEFYGTVEWCSKAVFSHYLGCFSGKASFLHPSDSTAKAKYIASLCDTSSLLELARKANERGEHQWALSLVSQLMGTSGEARVSSYKVFLHRHHNFLVIFTVAFEVKYPTKCCREGNLSQWAQLVLHFGSGERRFHS